MCRCNCACVYLVFEIDHSKASLYCKRLCKQVYIILNFIWQVEAIKLSSLAEVWLCKQKEGSFEFCWSVLWWLQEFPVNELAVAMCSSCTQNWGSSWLQFVGKRFIIIIRNVPWQPEECSAWWWKKWYSMCKELWLVGVADRQTKICCWETTKLQ